MQYAQFARDSFKRGLVSSEEVDHIRFGHLPAGFQLLGRATGRVHEVPNHRIRSTAENRQRRRTHNTRCPYPLLRRHMPLQSRKKSEHH
jgi:hypothetical protein